MSRSAQAGLTTSDYHMLAKLGYDLPNHPSEEADWVNVLLAQVRDVLTRSDVG